MKTKTHTPKKTDAAKQKTEVALDGATCSRSFSDTPKADEIARQFKSGEIHSDFLLLSLAQMERVANGWENLEIYRGKEVNKLRESMRRLAKDWQQRSANGGPESLLLAADELSELLEGQTNHRHR